MKFVRFFVVFSIVIVSFFSGCKKGEDDPAISFRSRKARLTGDWEMVSGKASFSTITPGKSNYSEDYTFNGSMFSVLTTTSSGSGQYYLTLSIKKDGTFDLVENADKNILVASGSWDFNLGVGETKKKEELIMSINEVIGGRTNLLHLFNKYRTEFTYRIKELRNKKLVLTADTKMYINANGELDKLTCEYTFKQ